MLPTRFSTFFSFFLHTYLASWFCDQAGGAKHEPPLIAQRGRGAGPQSFGAVACAIFAGILFGENIFSLRHCYMQSLEEEILRDAIQRRHSLEQNSPEMQGFQVALRVKRPLDMSTSLLMTYRVGDELVHLPSFKHCACTDWSMSLLTKFLSHGLLDAASDLQPQSHAAAAEF